MAGESPAVRLVLVGSFHLTIGLARRGDHLSLRSNFFAPGGASGIASQGIFARVERPLVTLRRILTKVFCCFVFHKRLVMLVYQVFNEPDARQPGNQFRRHHNSKRLGNGGLCW